MASNQSAVLIPPMYADSVGATLGQNLTDCGTHDCTSAMIDWAEYFFAWAQDDPRVVALTPFKWNTNHATCGALPKGVRRCVGGKDVPALRAKWETIGKAIVEGQDVAFTAAAPRQGFVGVYNAAVGTVADGHNTSAYDVGAWSPNAVENSPSQGSVSLADNIKFLCETKDTNQLYGMLIAASEGGVFNNPNDTALLAPLPLCSKSPAAAECARGATGMLQGAARWSKLSRSHCPQIAGVIIDDFWGNYDAGPPVPPPTARCASCPSTASHIYGSFNAGFYCCPWTPTGGHCVPPASSDGAVCCLYPGATEEDCVPKFGGGVADHK